MRINKYLASCGIASRRKCEEYITGGKVTVNETVQTNLATDIKGNDIVKLDGNIVEPENELVYFALNKPKGYISSVKDDRGRKVVTSLINTSKRIFPVGRLDYNTEGLLILTNDGELMNKLTHPRNVIGKTYVAIILGNISEADLNKLRQGVVIDNYKLRPCEIEVLERYANKTKLKITIFEGRNREIRKMFETISRKVIELERIKIANLEIGSLKRGEYRKLTQQEIDYLKSL